MNWLSSAFAELPSLVWRSAGRSESEIAVVTGHGHKNVGVQLDRRYLSRRNALGENAIRKLETGTKLENGRKMRP